MPESVTNFLLQTRAEFHTWSTSNWKPPALCLPTYPVTWTRLQTEKNSFANTGPPADCKSEIGYGVKTLLCKFPAASVLHWRGGSFARLLEVMRAAFKSGSCG